MIPPFATVDGEARNDLTLQRSHPALPPSPGFPRADILGPRAFAPVKGDINGNLKKIRGHFENNPEGCKTLQSMVQVEIDAKTTTKKGSATDALLWLKRCVRLWGAQSRVPPACPPPPRGRRAVG